MAIALYYIFLLFPKKQDRVALEGTLEAIEYGKLADYVIDGDDMYGLYLRLCGWSVFVDVRQDEQLEARKIRAYGLFENSSLLENSAKEFLLANPGYAKCTISIIGLHSADINQCEVFWEPERYTLIRGYVFVAD